VRIAPSEWSTGAWSVNVSRPAGHAADGFVVVPGTPLPPSQLLLFGESHAIVVCFDSDAHSVGDIVLLNLKTHAVTDRFMTVQPAVSPSGRFIVWQRRAARYEEGKYLPVVLLYDLLRTPGENRAASALIGYQDAGIPVYPSEAAQSGQYQVLREKGAGEWKLVSRDFTWLSASEVAFAFRANMTLKVVVVDMADSGVVAELLEREVDLLPLLKGRSAGEASRVVVDEIRLRKRSGTTWLFVRLGPPEDFLTPWVDVKR
jgi:hypothetical protein